MSSHRRPRAVWRPTRGARAVHREPPGTAAAQPDPRTGDTGYGAPDRGWRTADGGYRSPNGGWQAPYEPYDTAEWRRGQHDDPADVYQYDPLTLGGGESPTIRYDPASASYAIDDHAPGTHHPPAPQPERFAGTYPEHPFRPPRNLPPPDRPAPAHPTPDPEEDAGEEEVDEQPGYLRTALVTVVWYAIPLLLYTMYVLTLDGPAQATDGRSTRATALGGLLAVMPQIGVALAMSVGIAGVVRLIGRGWQAASIGFSAAVVGAAMATIVFTALQR